VLSTNSVSFLNGRQNNNCVSGSASNYSKLLWGLETMSRTQTFEWFSKFRSGLMSVKDSECIGHYF
jgi:hypothetical protein